MRVTCSYECQTLLAWAIFLISFVREGHFLDITTSLYCACTATAATQLVTPIPYAIVVIYTVASALGCWATQGAWTLLRSTLLYGGRHATAPGAAVVHGGYKAEVHAEDDLQLSGSGVISAVRQEPSPTHAKVS